jgi:hypothetical protein
MTDAAHRYNALLERLLQGRDGGSLTQEVEESILDEMDDLWWSMSEEDRISLDMPPEVGR